MSKEVSSAPASRQAGRGAGRPRSEASRRAVLDAAYAILVQSGLGSFSIDAVATRSGVARATIYRWWPTKGLLAGESLLEAFRPQLTYTTSDCPMADFRTLIGSLARALTGPAGRIAVSVVAAAQSDDDTRDMFRHEFSEPLRKESAALLQSGIDIGRFRRNLDIPRVLDATIGGIYLRLLLGQPIDPDWAAALADTILEGCLAPVDAQP